MFMKNIYKFASILLLSLLTPTVCSSQTTYPTIVNDSLILLTSSQLKHTNLIFAEHQMLLKKVDLLESQTQQYKLLVSNYEENDSVNKRLLEVQKEYYIGRLSSLKENLYNETKKKSLYKYGMFGTIGAAILAIIFVK